MALKLIGAGFGRNGTRAMKDALELIGYGPCYHMAEVHLNPDHVDIWDKAAEGDLPDWHQVFADYQATVDWPACNFWRELRAAFPDAKVLLSVRDPEAWYASIDKTIFDTWRNDVPADHPTYALRVMTKKLIMEGNFGGDIEDKDHVISVYNAHNEAVKAEVPADQLLVHEVGAGWEPLCAFLGVPVPDEPFPNRNSTKDFRAAALEQTGRDDKGQTR